MTEPEAPQKAKPLYWRVLQLRHVQPNSWQRAVFFEGSIAVATVLVLADLASAWLLLVLPVAVAVVVKGHDVLVGWHGPAAQPADEPATDAYASVLTLEVDEPAADQPTPETDPAPEPDPPPEPDGEPVEPNVRVVPPPKPRPARARPGAAAARAQVSSSGVRRRAETTPRDANSSS